MSGGGLGITISGVGSAAGARVGDAEEERLPLT